MDLILGVIALLIAAILTFLVLIQNSKGGGLSSAFGASNISSMVGARRAAQDIEKFTWYMAAALAVVAFVANIFVNTGEAPDNLRMKEQIENSDFDPAQYNRPLPSAPAEQPAGQ